MKTLPPPFKHITFLICLFGSVVFLSNCSSGNKDTAVTVNTDSLAQANDSSKLLQLQKNDSATITDNAADTLPEAPSLNTHKPLTLVIKNMQTPDGPIVVGVYMAKNKFLDEKDEYKKYTLSPKGNKGILTISDLEYGEFALALFQDVNSDGVINKNPIGIPKEPYAFSNNYKPVIRAPYFKDCKFDYSASADTLVISMIK